MLSKTHFIVTFKNCDTVEMHCLLKFYVTCVPWESKLRGSKGPAER